MKLGVAFALALVVMTMVTSSPSLAGEGSGTEDSSNGQGASYLARFDEIGEIQALSANHTHIVVNALSYTVAPSVEVLDPAGRKASLLDLRKGETVGVVIGSQSADDAGVARLIQLLPKGSGLQD